MKKFLFTTFLTFTILCLQAQTIITVGGIKYYETGVLSVGVTRSTYSGNIAIPSSIVFGGVTYSVTSIGDSAFYQCSNLNAISIPNSITSIGKSAFNGCIGLTSILLPNNINLISDFTFYGCSGLTSMTIPSAVTSIGIYAFNDCFNLESITIPNSVTTIDFLAFSRTKWYDNQPNGLIYTIVR
jgi:hypothetical protein